MATPNVSFMRTELVRFIKEYYEIRDCLLGQSRIKEKGEAYLPMPDSHLKNCKDNGKAVLARYKAYVARAVFYNVSRRTMSGLLGQVFMRDPEIKIPEAMKPIVEDATGSGIDLTQQSKKLLSLVLAYSRAGVFIDYPNTDSQGGVTLEQLRDGNIRPTINVYSPMNIVNWRVTKVGAKELLSLVVIYEGWPYEDDGFEIKYCPQYTVLKLDGNGNYVIEKWRQEHPSNYNEMEIKQASDFVKQEVYKPKGPDGEPLKQIPFSFVGSENNDANVDAPNFYDLASLNIAHYRNSADYEEAVYMLGQPTPVLTGLNDEWLKEQLKGVVNFGSRGGIPLPVGGDAKLLQAQENTMMKEAMEAKERQMVALGAKLVEQKTVQRTATETKIEATSEGSILSSSANNVSSAIEFALDWCAKFMGISEPQIMFKLNTSFDINQMTPEQQRMYIESWQKGATTWDEMRTGLRQGGLQLLDDNVAKEKIAKEQAELLAQAVAMEQAQNVGE